MTSLEKNHSPRERHPPTTTTSSHFDYGGLEVQGDKEYFNGETLSLGINRILGMDIYNKCTPSEQKIIGSNYDLLKLISEQKIFHVSGIILEFEVIQRRLYQVKNVLVRRNLLKTGRWKGTAKRTLGMVMYLTKECSKEDVNDYLRDYNNQDLLRMDKQIQRQKTPKTAEYVVAHADKVKKLSEQAKIDAIPTPELCEHGMDPLRCLVIICIEKRKRS